MVKMKFLKQLFEAEILYQKECQDLIFEIIKEQNNIILIIKLNLLLIFYQSNLNNLIKILYLMHLICILVQII